MVAASTANKIGRFISHLFAGCSGAKVDSVAFFLFHK